MSELTRELGSGFYYAIRRKDSITVSALGIVPCYNWDIRLEQRPERIFPPMFALYFYKPDVCLRAIKGFQEDASFAVEESAKIESVIVTDISGDNTVPVLPEAMPRLTDYMSEVEKSAGKVQYIVIARVGTKFADCRVIPEDSLFIATHFRAFGPASKPDCDAWVAKNCGR